MSYSIEGSRVVHDGDPEGFLGAEFVKHEPSIDLNLQRVSELAQQVLEVQEPQEIPRLMTLGLHSEIITGDPEGFGQG